MLSVTRNADINPDDEAFELEEDFRLRMKKVLKKRARLSAHPARNAGQAGRRFPFEYLLTRLGLKPEQVYRCESPIDMSYVYGIEAKFDARIIRRTPFVSALQTRLAARTREKARACSKQIARHDLLIHHPYESMEPFLRLIREAALDPAVLSIKIALYRIDKQSRLAESLIMAAENGRDVTVMMELRARFDEQNNIEWAERLEDAGCRVLYGIDGFKAHSKICLITRREKGRIQYFTQVGTGNYNEKTAALYSDLSLMTADADIGLDAAAFFKNMAISNLDGQYGHLLVAPNGFKRNILALIQGEIDKAGRICPAAS